MPDRRDLLRNGIALSTAMSIAQIVPGIGQAKTGTGLQAKNAPWPLRASEAFEYPSQAVGDTMAIGVWSPFPSPPLRNEDGNAPLDVIYVLDGSFALAAAATACRLALADLISPGATPVLLVGVDYPVGETNARTRDYTMRDSVPANLQKVLASRGPDTPENTPGGADKFLRFLEGELDPLIRSRYNTTNKPAGIIGDSFGGTFAFYAFIQQSRLFDRYWLGSPGLFTTDTDYVEQFRQCLKGDLVHPTKMFLSIGSKEMSSGIDFYDDLGRNFNRLLGTLRTHPSDRLEWSSKVYEGHTHTSVLLPALNDAMIYLLKPDEA